MYTTRSYSSNSPYATHENNLYPNWERTHHSDYHPGYPTSHPSHLPAHHSSQYPSYPTSHPSHFPVHHSSHGHHGAPISSTHTTTVTAHGNQYFDGRKTHFLEQSKPTTRSTVVREDHPYKEVSYKPVTSYVPTTSYSSVPAYQTVPAYIPSHHALYPGAAIIPTRAVIPSTSYVPTTTYEKHTRDYVPEHPGVHVEETLTTTGFRAGKQKRFSKKHMRLYEDEMRNAQHVLDQAAEAARRKDWSQHDLLADRALHHQNNADFHWNKSHKI